MTKEHAKIRVAFVSGNEGLLIATAILRAHDLYTIRHLFPLTGKHSYHESGASHSDNELVGLRDAGAKVSAFAA